MTYTVPVLQSPRMDDRRRIRSRKPPIACRLHASPSTGRKLANYHLVTNTKTGHDGDRSNFFLRPDASGGQGRGGVLRTDSMPAPKRRSNLKRDAMSREETETLLSPASGQDHLQHHHHQPHHHHHLHPGGGGGGYPEQDDDDEDDGYRVDLDTEPLTPTSPPTKTKYTYMPQFIPPKSLVHVANPDTPPRDSYGSLTTAGGGGGHATNASLPRPPKMALLRKRDSQRSADHGLSNKKSQRQDSEGNILPLNRPLHHNDRTSDFDNQTSANQSNSGASNGGRSAPAASRIQSAAVPGLGEPNAMSLDTLGERARDGDEPENGGVYAETSLDNENLHVDGEYTSDVDIDGRNLGNIINNLDNVIKDNRLAFIDDFD